MMDTALRTVGEAIRDFARSAPDEIAVICVREDGSVDTLSRSELDDWSGRLATLLQEKGVTRGQLVPIVLPNSTAHIAATMAAYKAGGTPTSISYSLPRKERDALIDLANAVTVIGDNADIPGAIAPDREALGPVAVMEDCSTVASPLKAVASGGSTGRPKLIVTQGDAAFPHSGHPLAALLRFGPDDLLYSPGPLYHNGPFFFSILQLIQGGRILLNERFRASRCLELIDRYQPTLLNLVPTMMQRMLRDPGWGDSNMDSVKGVWHYASACPAWAKQGFIDKLGATKVLELWAATESTGLTMIDGVEWLERRGSVGRGVLTEFKIVDEERRELPTGEVGEIFSRFGGGPPACEYLGAPALEMLDGGFTSVGDLGYLDEEGYLYLADRRTDMIISGGANIFPAEIEAVISGHPDVRDVAVIGLQDDDLGRRVHAVVEPRDILAPPDTGVITALCGEQLARYKVPRSIEFVEVLPRNEAGKIRRLALREARGG
jgi:bile acid-coenzyme A ligase